MSITIKKAVFGLVLSMLALGVFVLAAFWVIATMVDRILGWGPVLSVPWSSVLGATSMLIGVYWVSWAYGYLVFVGKGLPIEWFGVALHPTRVLVTTGPYAYVRNPAMIGLLFLGLGVAFLAASLAGIILVPIMAVLVSVYLLIFEEKGLLVRFGEEYDDYRRHVPLLIPRMTPYIHKPQPAT